MTKTYSQTEVADMMWDAIEGGQHTGMLGVHGDGHHSQPMTAFSVDLMTAPEAEIPKGHAVLTVVDGQVVYEKLIR